MFSEEKLSPTRQKKQSIGIKSFYSNISSDFEYKKKRISKLSIKMFLKRENRVGKAYAYRMLLCFKTSVAYNFFLTSRWTTVSVMK